MRSERVNAAAIREALIDTVGLLESIFESFSKGTSGVYMADVAETIDNANAALSVPPRNCDAFSKAEVLKVLEDRSFSKEDTIEWLYSTAEERKGCNNGGK